MSWFIASLTSESIGLCCFVSRNIIQHLNPILEKDIGFFCVKKLRNENNNKENKEDYL